LGLCGWATIFFLITTGSSDDLAWLLEHKRDTKTETANNKLLILTNFLFIENMCPINQRPLGRIVVWNFKKVTFFVSRSIFISPAADKSRL